MKSSVDEIRRRFDADVERFSNLQTGQSATVDAPLAMSLVAEAAAATTPHTRHVLDIGCGAGNYTIKLLEHLPGLDATLLDLSRPMLDRAAERVGAATAGRVMIVQADVREATFPDGSFDVILAAAVLHHLRTDAEWEAVFGSFFRWLRPGGSVWVFDLVASPLPAVQALMWRHYGEYLTGLKGEQYRDDVFAYVEKEDTPRPLGYQLELLTRVGFHDAEVLHKHLCFAAFGAVNRHEGDRVNDFRVIEASVPGRPEAFGPADITIDGVRLIDLLRRVEAAPAAAEGSPELAGEYASLSARTTFFPSRHFLGDTRPLLTRAGKTVLLICTCGCEGCWDFVGRITVSDRTITWGEFEQVHRDWDYSALGEFVFDRRQYEAELRFPTTVGGEFEPLGARGPTE